MSLGKHAMEQGSENSRLHWGPKCQDAFPVKGAIGAIITLGVMLIVLIGVPQARLWLFISIPVGILVAMLLHFVRNHSE